MIKVALVSTWPPERCGIASHSGQIVKHADRDVQYVKVGRPFDRDQILKEAADCQIIHISYERNSHRNIQAADLMAWKQAGKKVLLQDHNFNSSICAVSFAGIPDAVVTQDPIAAKGMYYVPQGVMHRPLLDSSLRLENSIGTAGFPTVQKGGLIAAQVARHFNMGFTMFAPRSQHANADWMKAEVLKIVPNAKIITDFWEMEDIADELSRCLFTCWLYAECPDASGISGSVRLGIAAMRPMIVSRPRMYRDLLQPEYQNDFYFTPDGNPTFEQVKDRAERLLSDIVYRCPRQPVVAYREMDWNLCGLLYGLIYRKMLGQNLDPLQEATLRKYER